MRITEKLMVKDQLISFEVFPPKTDSAFESIEWSVRELAAYNPDFMSVTYGAGGGTSQYTTKIASLIKNRLDTTALAHLTCASTPKDKIKEILDTLKENHIDIFYKFICIFVIFTVRFFIAPRNIATHSKNVINVVFL